MPAFALLLSLVAACVYDIPMPACGFVCGPGNECPSGYACDADGRCRQLGTRLEGSCAGLIPPDAPPELVRPYVTSVTPANGQTDVSPTLIILVQFSEPVRITDESSVALYRGEVPQPTIMTVRSGDLLELAPVEPLVLGYEHTVRLTESIVDLADNSLEPFVSSFTPGDGVAPFLTATYPEPGATNVSVKPVCRVIFDDLVYNVSASTLRLLEGTTLVPATVSTDDLANVGRLDPSFQLAPNTSYTIDVSSAITDIGLNPFAGAQVTFTTGSDAFPPDIRRVVPGTDAILGVGQSVRVYFDEIVAIDATRFTLAHAGTPVPATVTFDPTTRVATLQPASQLPPSSIVAVALAPAIADTSGNLLSSTQHPTTWTYTTRHDDARPRVRSTSPADNASGVAVTTVIRVTFDEPVSNVGPSTFVVTGAGTGSYAAADAGQTWVFTPAAPMPASTMISVMLTAGITDAYGNTTSPSMFEFATAP